jgi:hypothetical protein
LLLTLLIAIWEVESEWRLNLPKDVLVLELGEVS